VKHDCKVEIKQLGVGELYTETSNGVGDRAVKSYGLVGWVPARRRGIKSFILDILSLRCLKTTQVEEQS
jgi:hypothetical protein